MDEDPIVTPETIQPTVAVSPPATPPAAPVPQAAAAPAEPRGHSITQEDLDRRLAVAKRSGETALLAKLKKAGIDVDSLDQVAESLKSAEDLKRKQMTDVERLKADLEKERRLRQAAEAKAQEANRKVDLARKRADADRQERLLVEQFGTKGVPARWMRFALDQYADHVNSANGNRLAPDKFVESLRKDYPEVFAATLAPARASTSPEAPRTAPTEAPPKAKGEVVDDLNDVDFKRRTADKYGFRPSH